MKTETEFPTGITVRALAAVAAICLTACAALTLTPAAQANVAPAVHGSETVDGIEVTYTGVVVVGDDIQLSGSTATRTKAVSE